MRVWINTNCINDEQNKCVCPICRWGRLNECRPLTEKEVGQLNEELRRWTKRTETLENNMKKRFPKE